MREEIVFIKNADIRRGSKYLLKNVSLTIKKGENWCIFGPNGAGKSSLIKMICNDYHPLPKEGTIRKIFGKERWNIWDLKSHLGIISNDLHSIYSANLSSTGYDVVVSGFFGSIGVYQDVSIDQKNKALEVVNFLSIENLLEKKVSIMSTGEARKCLIGRALVSNPECMILDEPTTGLDIKAQHDFIKLMRKLIKNGISIILITHHVEEIFPEINKVAFLSNGEIISKGSKENILTSENLSLLFGENIDLITKNGEYRVFMS